MQRPWMVAAYCLALYDLFSLLFYRNQGEPRDGPTHNRLDSQQSLVKRNVLQLEPMEAFFFFQLRVPSFGQL